MRPIMALLVVSGILVGAPSCVPADPSKDEPAAREDPMYADGVKAVKRGDYATAIRLFEAIVVRDDRNADAYNWLAYSTRQAGDAQRAVPIYQKALAIDPKHRGAHEYIGEPIWSWATSPRPRSTSRSSTSCASSRARNTRT